MKKTAITIAFALSACISGTAFGAGHSQNPVQCSISCNQGYSQCMASGVDWSLVSSVDEASGRMSSNMSAARACREEATACYSHCLQK